MGPGFWNRTRARVTTFTNCLLKLFLVGFILPFICTEIKLWTSLIPQLKFKTFIQLLGELVNITSFKVGSAIFVKHVGLFTRFVFLLCYIHHLVMCMQILILNVCIYLCTIVMHWFMRILNLESWLIVYIDNCVVMW